MAEHEEWRAVLGFEGLYEVSSFGNVRALPRELLRRSRKGRIIIKRYGGFDFEASLSGSGYLRVPLSNGSSRSRSVHVMVCEAFHGPRPPGAHAAHLDGNRLNPRADNLQWKTPVENAADRRKHGTHLEGAQHPHAKLTEDQVRAIRASSKSVASLSREYGLTCAPMWMAKNGKTYRNVI